MANNSTFEKVLLVCNRNAKLLRLLGVTFGFSQKDEKEKFDNSEMFAEKYLRICIFIEQ